MGLGSLEDLHSIINDLYHGKSDDITKESTQKQELLSLNSPLIYELMRDKRMGLALMDCENEIPLLAQDMATLLCEDIKDFRGLLMDTEWEDWGDLLGFDLKKIDDEFPLKTLEKLTEKHRRIV